VKRSDGGGGVRHGGGGGCLWLEKAKAEEAKLKLKGLALA